MYTITNFIDYMCVHINYIADSVSTISPLADKSCVVSYRVLHFSGKLAGAEAEDSLVSSLVEYSQDVLRVCIYGCWYGVVINYKKNYVCVHKQKLDQSSKGHLDLGYLLCRLLKPDASRPQSYCRPALVTCDQLSGDRSWTTPPDNLSTLAAGMA